MKLTKKLYKAIKDKLIFMSINKFYYKIDFLYINMPDYPLSDKDCYVIRG